MKEALAKDILGELEPRLPCGRYVTRRVGRRGWERPRVCISARLYKQYRVQDPWDPNPKAMNEDIGLGSVALRLGENRRQPAPHLKPKETKKKTPSLPAAPKARKKPATTSEPSKRATPAGKQPAVDPEIERLRAAAAEKRERAEQARSWPRRRQSPAADPSAPERSAVPPLPVRPEARGEGETVPDLPDSPSDEVSAQPPRTKPSGRQRAGRFRMQSTSVQRAPVVRSIAADQDPAAPVEPPTEEPVTPARSTASGGLDDLFGAAAQAGRLQMSKRAPAPTESEEE